MTVQQVGMKIVGVLTLVLLTGCLEPPQLRPRDPTPGVPHVRVTTFNVDLKMYDDVETIEAVASSGADIVALQETSAGWQAALQGRYADEYPHMEFRGSASGGLAILSKFPFEDRGVVEGVDGWHPAWHLLVDSPIGILQVLIVHLRPPYSKREGIGGYFDVERDHLVEVQSFSAPCEVEYATIILGDFNESTDGEAIGFLREQGYENVLPQYRPGQETWRYERSLYGQAIDTLDHIMYETNDLAPLNAYVRYDGNSDHLPVTAIFERRR